MNRKLLPIVWTLAIGSIVLLSGILKLESTHFFGIADDQEQTISFSYPVEIVQTYAVEGAHVDQGTQILEVRRRDLGTKLVILDDQIQAIKTTSTEEIATTRAQLEGLRAQQAAELAEIDSQILTLLSEQQMNKKLLEEISGSKTRIASKSPLETKIKGLKEQRVHIEKSLSAQIQNLEQQLNASIRPSDSKIAELEERKIEFQRQVTALKVRAKFNGQVGSINYKPGETVAPFQPILTVHGASPKYIKGYIHENVFNEVNLGQKVWVQSNTSTNNKAPILAVVESLGSRIVEYPVRLKKNMMVSAWGRETVIRLTGENNLLLGEKVIVSLNNPNSEDGLIASVLDFFSNTISQSQAKPFSKDPNEPDGYPIQSLIKDINDNQIEASGIIRDLNSQLKGDTKNNFYYIVSDESFKGKPELFKMNGQGELISRLPIDSSKKVDDLESISQENNSIYVMASLDGTKKGRRHLLQLQIDKDKTLLLGQVNIYKLLKKLARNVDDIETQKFLHKALSEKSIDLEAHSVHSNDLYLGFKSPHGDLGETIILKLDNIQQVMNGETVKGGIWKKITLLDPQTGAPSSLSDMMFMDEQLLLLSVNKNISMDDSHLWSYLTSTSKLTPIKSFHGLSAEGVTATNAKNELMVVFDGNGKTQSRFLPISIN